VGVIVPLLTGSTSLEGLKGKIYRGGKNPFGEVKTFLGRLEKNGCWGKGAQKGGGYFKKGARGLNNPTKGGKRFVGTKIARLGGV